MRRAISAAMLLGLAGLLVPPALRAQGEDAIPMPRHSFRVAIGADWAHYTNRFGTPNPVNPGIADGTPEPLGIDFGADSLGVQQLGFLAPVQSQIRTLTGVSNFTLDIGKTKLVLDASVRRMPIRLAWAATARLAFQVTVPIVRARMSAFLGLPDTSKAARGNVGPIIAANFDAFRVSGDSALRALAAQAASGPASLRSQAQAELNSLQPLVCGLSSLATFITDKTSPCFGGVGPVPFLPLDSSEAGDSITAQLGRAEASYASLRSQYAGQGITIPAFTSAYTLPGTSFDSTSLKTFFTSSSSVGGDSLGQVVRTGIGDIEIGGWYQLANGASWRSQLGLTVRLPTGKMDEPNNLIDIGTGDHQMDVQVGFGNDIILSRNLWVHAGGTYTRQMSDQLQRRVTPWYLPYAPASSLANVDRKLGDYYLVDVVPNWQLDDAFRFGLGWHYYHQGSTSFSYVDPTDEARIGLPASVLGLATSQTWMRVGAGLTFSTVERYQQGRARLPYRVTWSYNSTLWGRGGQTPKSGVMVIELQAFLGLSRPSAAPVRAAGP